MRYRLRTLLILLAAGPLLLTGVAVLLFGLFESEQSERPPPPMSPETEFDRRILKLADQFAKASGATDYAVPIRIEPWEREDGSFIVIYWTPRREFRLLGDRAVIVNPQSASVEFVMRD